MAASPLLKDLERTRRLLDRPEAWIQHDYAVDAAGQAVPARSRKAVGFCLIGAADRACRGRNESPLSWDDLDGEALAEAVLARPRLGPLAKALCRAKRLPMRKLPQLMNWNDESKRRHAHVVRLLDRAIENERLRCGKARR